MDFLEKMKLINKRWKIVDDKDYSNRLANFKVRISNIFKHVDRDVSEDDIGEFCNLLAITEVWNQGTIDNYSKNIIDAIYGEKNEYRLYRLLEIVLSLPSLTDRSGYFQKVKQAIELSKVNVSISMQDYDNVVLFPKGEKILDEKLVDEVLSFLTTAPRAHFIDSLNYYGKNTKANFVKAAESLRRSSEEFLRDKLGNRKGLSSNIVEAQAQLKKNGKDSNIRNIAFQVLSHLDKFYNENSKHGDGAIDEPECEYLIYQTGVIFRYLNKVL